MVGCGYRTRAQTLGLANYSVSLNAPTPYNQKDCLLFWRCQAKHMMLGMEIHPATGDGGSRLGGSTQG